MEVHAQPPSPAVFRPQTLILSGCCGSARGLNKLFLGFRSWRFPGFASVYEQRRRRRGGTGGAQEKKEQRESLHVSTSVAPSVRSARPDELQGPFS